MLVLEEEQRYELTLKGGPMCVLVLSTSERVPELEPTEFLWLVDLGYRLPYVFR